MHRIRVVRASNRAVARPVRIARSSPSPPANVRPVRPRSARAGPVGRRPASARHWRRRSRRAQVSAVATIFGLMLVVTFIANYLATTLPNQMQVNELNHEIQVENQLGHFRALLQGISGAGTPGAPVLQPITLGSVGVPPFGPPDGGVVSSIPGEPPAKASFGMVSTRYAPPTGWRQNGSAPACSLSPPPPNTNSITCTGSAAGNIWYNFAGSTNYAFSVKGNGQVSFVLNFSTNSSTIAVSAAGGAYNLIQIVGSHDSVNVSGTGGANLNVTVVGHYDNVTIGDKGGGTVNVLIVGNHDNVAVSNLGQSRTFVVGWGSYDFVSPSKNGGPYTVYFNGFDAQNPSSPICPYGTAALTDNVTGAAPSGSKVTYNNTVLNNTANPRVNFPYLGWTTIYNTPRAGACIFFPQFSAGGVTVFAAGLQVQLRNTYSPAAQVAFDEGAVVYVQPGGYPIFVQSPPIAFSHGSATVWVPAFLQQVGAESGAGTAAVSLHLVSVVSLSLPSNGWVLNPGRPLTLVYTTPYASAWYTYFATNPVYAGDVSCAPTGSAACQGPYESGGPLGTVTLVLPATSLTIQFALFSIGLS